MPEATTWLQMQVADTVAEGVLSPEDSMMCFKKKWKNINKYDADLSDHGVPISVYGLVTVIYAGCHHPIKVSEIRLKKTHL